MIVGILSDTHGRADTAAAAVKLLIERGAEYLVHCGDVGTQGVLDALAGHPSMFVFGNNDWDRGALAKYAGAIGVSCGEEEGKLSFQNKLAIVTHGDDLRIVNRVLQAQAVDYLFLGHTHSMLDSSRGKVRIINPGALYRASRKTVALLDTVSDTVEFLTIAEKKELR